MSHLKTFAKGVALGGLVGVIYGLFTAPKKGKELQKEAKQNIVKLVRKGKGLQKKVEPQIKRATRKVINKVKKTVKKANKNKKGKKK